MSAAEKLSARYYETSAITRNTIEIFPEKDYDMVKIYNSDPSLADIKYVWTDEDNNTVVAVKMDYTIDETPVFGCWILTINDVDKIKNDHSSLVIKNADDVPCESQDKLLKRKWN